MTRTQITLDAIVGQVQDLPVVGSAAMEVMRVAGGNVSADQIAEKLGQDPSLSMRVLRLANSSYYGCSRQVNDLGQAVVVLGSKTIRSIAMASATYPWMSQPLAGYGLGPKAMWTHSFAAALAARQLAALSRKADPEQAFTAGLVHDIGKIALSIWIRGKTDALVHLAKRDGASFDAVERKVLGFDHAEAGSRLAERWNLPESVVSVIAWHHRPFECPRPTPLHDCVHVGAWLVTSIGLGLGSDSNSYAYHEASLGRLGLQVSDFDSYADNLVVAYEEYERLFRGMEAA